MNGKNLEIHKGLIVEHGCGYIDPLDDRNSEFINEMKNFDKGGGSLSIVEPLRLFVILQKYDTLNKNGRVYPEKILRREAKRYQEIIDARQAIGENDHQLEALISSDRVAIEIKKIWFEGKTLVGELEIIMSPGFIKYGIISCQGDIIANLLRLGIRIGVSSRGVGSVIQDKGVLYVQDDFEIICWDVVVHPSTNGGYIFPDENKSQIFKESEEKDPKLLLIDEKLKNFLLK